MNYKGFYSGQTLLSLLLSLSLSSFLLTVILAFFTQTQRQNKQMFDQLRLQNELQQTIQLIAKDLRRAGFRGASKNLKQDNLSLFAQPSDPKFISIAQATGETAESCVLFFYDLDGNGCVGGNAKSGYCLQHGENNTKGIQKELFGYRLKNHSLEIRAMYKSAVKQNCTPTECASYLHPTSCDADKRNWTALVDNKTYQISQFKLTWLAEKTGIQIDLKGYLTSNPKFVYETRAIVPLLNERF